MESMQSVFEVNEPPACTYNDHHGKGWCPICVQCIKNKEWAYKTCFEPDNDYSFCPIVMDYTPRGWKKDYIQWVITAREWNKEELKMGRVARLYRKITHLPD